MTRIKKIVKQTLYGLLALIIAIILLGNFYTHYYGYDESDNPFFHPRELTFFNDSVSKQLNFVDMFNDRAMDSIYILNYKNKYHLVLWALSQYQNAILTNVVDMNQRICKEEQLVYYYNISPQKDSRVRFESKIFLNNYETFSAYFNGCTEIKLKKQTNDIQYYHLRGGAIYLVSGENKYYDIKISLGYNVDMDFMIRKVNDKIYLIALYPLKGEKIDPEELHKFIKF